MSGIDSTLTKEEWVLVVDSLYLCGYKDLSDRIEKRIGA